MRHNVVVKGYRFVNKDKFIRAVESCGKTVGDKEVLTAYDRMGGKLLKVSSKGITSVVETGTFWNFEEGQPQRITLNPEKVIKKIIKKKTAKKKK